MLGKNSTLATAAAFRFPPRPDLGNAWSSRNANSCNARKARRAMEVRSLTTESSIGRASPRVGRTCSEWLLRTAERAEEYLLASGYRFKQSMQLLPEQFLLRQ